MSSYDKLGELLKNALENDSFPKSRKNTFHNKNASSEAETAEAEETSDENKNPHSTEKALPDASKTENQILKSLSAEFSVLGIEPTDNLDTIKSAYHEKLKKYHPDNVPKLVLVQKTAARKTQEIIQAYRTLLSKLS